MADVNSLSAIWKMEENLRDRRRSAANSNYGIVRFIAARQRTLRVAAHAANALLTAVCALAVCVQWMHGNQFFHFLVRIRKNAL